MPSDAQKLFISYTQVDRPWAEWIAWQLEEAGYKAILQAWHFGAGSNFVERMHQALRDAGRVIAVISPAYENSAFGSTEWQGAFVNDPTGEARKLVPVRVERYQPTGLLTPIVYIDLVDLDEQVARARLLEGLRGPGKPEKAPRFPRDKNERPRFPGGNSEGRNERPDPVYVNEETQELAKALKAAHRQRAELEARGEDTAAAAETILDLRRRIREGGQLKAGDSLLDGRFELIEPLGRGGFAQVWKAYDETEKKLVAVKVLHGQYAQDRTRRERFFRGARHMAELRHPGIVPVIEKECEDGVFTSS